MRKWKTTLGGRGGGSEDRVGREKERWGEKESRRKKGTERGDRQRGRETERQRDREDSELAERGKSSRQMRLNYDILELTYSRFACQFLVCDSPAAFSM